MNHTENHHSHRTGWLRAVVLGANDGIVSIASLIIGVAAAHTSREEILLAGIAGLVAGAMSMAAGEYVSVSSQADAEQADIALEQRHLNDDLEFEIEELKTIYIQRGLTPELAQQVAVQLMNHDALGTHLRDELGIQTHLRAKPIQAAIASAGMFTLGASMPLIATMIASDTAIISIVASFSIFSLASLGALAAYLGGANIIIGCFRVTFWGALAMLVTAITGKLFGMIS